MMISTVAGFQIQMIPSRWYIDEQKDKDVATDVCYFVNQKATQHFSGMTLTPNPSTILRTVTAVLHYAAKRKLKYGEVWGLVRQAAQLAIEHENHGEMVQWLRQFINRHKEMITQTGIVQN